MKHNCPRCSQRKVNASCRNGRGSHCKTCCLALGGCSMSGHSLDSPQDTPSPPLLLQPRDTPLDSQISLPQFTFEMPIPSRDTRHKRHSQSSRTGHLNVITDNDMVPIIPRPRVAPELALIDRTLEELEADEPDWDIWCHWNGSIAQSSTSQSSISTSASISPAKKRVRTMSASSFRSPQPSPQSALTLPWPSGLTVSEVSDAFRRIFDEGSLSLSPRQRFETHSGEQWNPDVFYLHYDLWKAMSEEDLKAGKSLDWVSFVQGCDFTL